MAGLVSLLILSFLIRNIKIPASARNPKSVTRPHCKRFEDLKLTVKEKIALLFEPFALYALLIPFFNIQDGW